MGNSKTNEFGYGFHTTCDEVLKNIDLSGKHFFVTGGSSGIGKEVSKSLYSKNGIVTIASNKKDEVEEAILEITTAHPISTGKILGIFVDLSSKKSISICCEEVISEFPKIDVLYCNAGVMMIPLFLNEDGFEGHLAINFVGHYIMVMKLLKHINEKGRIVITSSKGHKEFGANINFKDLEFKKVKAITPGKRIIRARAYGQSKLACLLFGRELNVRLKNVNSSITCYSLHPGVVHTKLQKADIFTSMYYDIGKTFFRYFKTLQEGAATSIFLGTDERVLKYSGEYFENCGLSINISDEAKDMKVAKRLWDLTEKRTGIKFPENLNGVVKDMKVKKEVVEVKEIKKEKEKEEVKRD